MGEWRNGRPACRQAGAMDSKLMHHVYAIKSKLRKYIYVGMTNNLERRFFQHNTGKEKTTAFYKPFDIILDEEYQTRQEARKREKYLKSGICKERLKKMK